jgi:hypothetical protein
LRLKPMDGAGLFAYVRHASNAWRFACGEIYGAGGWWRVAEPTGFAADRDFYARLSRVAINVNQPPMPAVATRPTQAVGVRHGR